MLSRVTAYVGVALFIIGALVGFNILLMLIGVAFVAAASLVEPRRRCFKCAMTVPDGATVCGHCGGTL
jgi:hypothetical protein